MPVPADVALAPVGGNGGRPRGRGRVGAAPRAGGVVLQLPAGVGLAVISGLADDFRVSPDGDGTSVAMSWKRPARTRLTGDRSVGAGQKRGHGGTVTSQPSGVFLPTLR